MFLDEPTTGFDPAARHAAWETVRSLRDLGKTILLTTHYLDEAQELADRVAIVKDGRVLAIGPPRELGVGGVALPRRLPRPRRRAVEQQTDDPTRLLNELTAEALARGERLRGAERRAPDARGRLPGADRGCLRLACAGRRPAHAQRADADLAPVPPRAPDVLAQPERRLLQLRAAAAVPRRRRGDPARQPAPAQPARAGDRGHERDVDDIHGAGLQHRVPARARRAEAHPRDAAARRAPTSAASPRTRSPTRRCRSRSSCSPGGSSSGSAGPRTGAS